MYAPHHYDHIDVQRELAMEYALAAGWLPLDDQSGEKLARRQRYQRRKGKR